MKIDKVQTGEDIDYNINGADIQDICATILNLLVKKDLINMNEFIQVLNEKTERRKNVN